MLRFVPVVGIFVAAWCLGGGWVRAEGCAPTSAPDAGVASQVSRVLAELDADDFSRREAATRSLDQLSPDAIPLLEKAMVRSDLSEEVRSRLQTALPQLRERTLGAKYQQKIAKETIFIRESFWLAYKAAGHTSPKWDEAVHQAMPVAIHTPAMPLWTTRDSARGRAAIRKAIDLGCDDPLVGYLELRLWAEAEDAPPTRIAGPLGPLVDSVVAGNYPDWRKALARLYRARVTLGLYADIPPEAGKQIREELDAALLLFAAGTRAPDFPESLRLEIAQALFAANADVSHDPKAAFEKVAPVLKSLCASAATPLIFEGDAAMAQLNNRLRPLDDAARQKLIGSAATAFRLAWEADASNPFPPTQMIRIADMSEMDANGMETWFSRAMKADPGCYDACRSKLVYLQDHGDQAGVLAFGRECFRGEKWESRVPFMLVDAHLFVGSFRAQYRYNAYLANDAVWKDIRDVYLSYLQLHPDSVRDRCFLANLAARSGHWEDAQAQFAILKDDVVFERFNGPSDYAYLKRLTAAHLALPADFQPQ